MIPVAVCVCVCVNAWKFCEGECTEGAIIRCGCKMFTKKKEYIFSVT